MTKVEPHALIEEKMRALTEIYVRGGMSKADFQLAAQKIQGEAPPAPKGSEVAEKFHLFIDTMSAGNDFTKLPPTAATDLPTHTEQAQDAIQAQAESVVR